MFTRWPTFLMTVAVLITVAIFFKKFDFLLMIEIKALMSVLFGFASSFILLSLIWLLQTKPLHDSWHSQSTSSSADTPNMHPRGSYGSDVSVDLRFGCPTVSAYIDEPPKYEEALINSKPVDNLLEKSKNMDVIKPNVSSIFEDSQHQLQVNLRDNFRCIKHKNEFVDTSRPVHLVSSIDCLICESERISATSNLEKDNQYNSNSGNNMAQLALSIVRGFTSFENPPTNTYHQIDGDTSVSLGDEHERRRKSFCELDASQLMLLSSSPPKYSDLPFSVISYSRDVSNTSNEARAGL